MATQARELQREKFRAAIEKCKELTPKKNAFRECMRKELTTRSPAPEDVPQKLNCIELKLNGEKKVLDGIQQELDAVKEELSTEAGDMSGDLWPQRLVAFVCGFF